MNPIRFAYVIKHLVALSFDFRGRRVLDVGCGGGFLTEEIAKFGLNKTAVDPSAGSLYTARKHAEAMKLVVDYRPGFLEIQREFGFLATYTWGLSDKVTRLAVCGTDPVTG